MFRLVKTVIWGIVMVIFAACSNNHSTPNALGTALLGNIADANVSIYEIGKLGLKTLKWEGKTTHGNVLDEIGLFDTHSSELIAETYYLYQIAGGEDNDADDDGLLDTHPTKNMGTFHALIKGSDLQRLGDSFTVTYLSELIYQAVKEDLGNEDFESSYREMAAMLLDTNVSQKTLDEIADAIHTFVPARDRNILNASLDVDNIAKGIEQGNKNYISAESLKSIRIDNPNNIFANSILPVTLDINVSRIYTDVMVSFAFMDGTEVFSSEPTVIPLLSPDQSEYALEVVVPEDITASSYYLHVTLGDDNATERSTTEAFAVTEEGDIQIDTLAFDETNDEGEDTVTRSLSTRSTQSKQLQMSYDDGNVTINTTVTIKNKFVDKNITNVKLGGYLEVNGNIITVPFEAVILSESELNSSASTYTNEIVIPEIEAGATMNVAYNIYISRDSLLTLLTEVVEDLVANLGQASQSKLVVTLKSDGTLVDSYTYPVTFFLSEEILEALADNAQNLLMGTITVEELLAQLETMDNRLKNRSLRAINTPSIPSLNYEKTFSSSKYGKFMGAGIYAKGDAGFDESGVHAKTYASVRVKLLKRKHYQIFKANLGAGIDLGSLEDTGYDIALEAFGLAIYTRGTSLAEKTGLHTPSRDDSIKDQVLRMSVQYAKVKATMLATTEDTLISYTKKWDYGLVKAKTSTVVVGFIPVVIEVGAQATLGFKSSIALKGINKLEVAFTPNARIGAWIDGGVGAGYSIGDIKIDYSAGVGGSFWLMSDDFKNSVTAALNPVGENYISDIEGTLTEDITNYFYGPHGRFYLYAKWFGPLKKSEFAKPWKWKNHKKTKTLSHWYGSRKKKTLLHKKQSLFKIQIVPDLGIKYIDTEGMALCSQNPLLCAPSSSKKILFAHGLNADKHTFSAYASYADDQGWDVYRTNVDRYGSIKTRATQLATYINGLGLEDDSLLAVGQSMGGLDLRYIVSEGHAHSGIFRDAAKKIKKIYTIATPHQGNMFTGVDISDKPALQDLGLDSMREFNEKHPYYTHIVDGRQIPMLALRFDCREVASFGSDGVVSIARQTLDDAPYSVRSFIGKHTDSTTLCSSEVEAELEQTDILQKILDNGIMVDTQFYTTHRDIVLYDELSCEGDPVGKFNSRSFDGVSKVDIDCSESTECKSNKAKSMLLYPNVKENTVIRLYDHPEKKTSKYDYTTIYRKSKAMSKPQCVNGFNTSKTYASGVKKVAKNVNHSKVLTGEVSHIKITNTGK